MVCSCETLIGTTNSILTICYIRFRLKPNTRLGTVGFYYSSVFNGGMPVKKCLELLKVPGNPASWRPVDMAGPTDVVFGSGTIRTNAGSNDKR